VTPALPQFMYRISGILVPTHCLRARLSRSYKTKMLPSLSRSKAKNHFYATFSVIVFLQNVVHSQWTSGPVDQWTSGPVDQWTSGPVDQWTNGPVDQWTIWCFFLNFKRHFWYDRVNWYIGLCETIKLFKILGFHSCDYDECVLGYKNPVRTSKQTHYVSATDPSQLMVRKIWGFHDGDYEECRFLGYKNPVRTSQETHYIPATDPSQLMLCKIWGFQGGNYEECRLLGYNIQFLPHSRHTTSPLKSSAG
jgi:hypothetical protein